MMTPLAFIPSVSSSDINSSDTRSSGTNSSMSSGSNPSAHLGAELGQLFTRLARLDELELREAFIRAVLDSLIAHTAVLAADGTIIAVNRAWIEFSEQNGGRPGETGIGTNYLEVCSGVMLADNSPAAQARAGIQAVLTGSVLQFQMDYPCDSPTEKRWFHLQVVPLLLPSGGAVVSHTNITERKRLEAQLAHQALHDPLTGLPNRVLLQDRLSQALARGARSSATISVLHVDLDRFRIVNDSLGHLMGDQLLKQVSQRLEELCQSDDTVARVGPDEFVVLSEACAGADGHLTRARAVLDLFSEPFLLNGHPIRINASVGIAAAAHGQSTADNLLRDAHAAMHAAKRGGGNRYEVADQASRGRQLKRLEIEASMRRAIEQHEFRVHYQPKVDLRTGRIAGVEALVRWQHAEKGMIGPADFIPVAEETGMVIPLGAWVLEQACRDTVRLHAAFPEQPRFRVAVNVSARQLARPELADEVAHILARTGIEPGLVCLEITESAVMEDTQTAIKLLHALKGLGVQLALDDFGTGYSSLSYLQRLPVDLLKIDRSFVSGLNTNSSDEVIVRSVISLGKALGLKLVAEGVETALQLETLRLLSCDLAQGYFLAKPLPAVQLEALLARFPRW